MSANDFFDGTYTATALIVILCCSLALYNSLELILLIFTTFKSYHGLYFWSLVIATTGVVPYLLGVLVIYFRLTSLIGGLVLLNYGWITMVTGQAVVLYSRLGIVLGYGHRNILRAVKWMIIVDAVLLHSTTLAISVGNWYAPDPRPWQLGYKYIEKIQMTVFCIQEFIISGLYVWKALDIIRTVTTDKQRTHRIMWQLFIINVIIIIFDIALLVIEYLDLRFDEFAFKALVYSVKLKLEFAILGQLVKYSGGGANNGAQSDSTGLGRSMNVPNYDTVKHDSTLKQSASCNLSDKGTVEHIENKTNSSSTSTQESQTSHSGKEELRTTALENPNLLRQNARKDSEDLYADAIRSITQPG